MVQDNDAYMHGRYEKWLKSLSAMSTVKNVFPTVTCLAMRLLTLTKDGAAKEQVDRSTTYAEVKTILKA